MDSPLMEELDAITEGKSKLDLAEEIWRLRRVLPELERLREGWIESGKIIRDHICVAPEAGVWTTTTERAPEGDGSVLGSGPSATTDGRWWIDIVSAGWVRRNPQFVTRWMPLPPLPQSGSGPKEE